MLSKTETVWRHVLDGTEQGDRRLPSVTALADDLTMGISTVHAALERPAAIGAVLIKPSGGVRIIDPYRLAVLWAGRRRLDRDVTANWATDIPPTSIEQEAISNTAGIVGGYGAVVHHLGRNRVADYDTALIYTADTDEIRALAPETADGQFKVMVAEPDPAAPRYGRYSTIHQAWVDLFTQPTWTAARFTEAITARWVTTDAA